MTSIPPASPDEGQPLSDTRRMGPIYVAVVVVEALTLLGLWWFQTTFGG